jgi:HECT-domain (ubiquitin-transferase)
MLAVLCVGTGFVPCEQCFSVIPLEAVKRLLFDDAGYDLDFVLSRMDPISEFGKYKIERKGYLDTQNLFFRVSSSLRDREGTFVELLRKKCAENKEFIRDFVWFVTGSYYIRQSDFKITLEFNYSEKWDENALPMVHTCDNTIKFPALVYDNNAEALEEKLEYAMKYAKRCAFDMS